MGRNSCDLQEEKMFCEEVKKYKCLYDKSFPGYKEKDG